MGYAGQRKGEGRGAVEGDYAFRAENAAALLRCVGAIR